MKNHPLAECFPRMSDDEWREFLDDVRANGIQEPAVVYDGMVLDGRHRHEAALELGIECPTVEYDGEDPAGFVISSNIRRRHLTPGERADIVVRARNWRPVGYVPPHGVDTGKRHERQRDTDGRPGERPRSDSEMAREAQVGVSTVRRAKERARDAETESEGGTTSTETDAPREPEDRRQPSNQKDDRIRALETENENLRNRNSELEVELEEVSDREAMWRSRYEAVDAQDAARAEQTFNNQRATINSLKAQMGELNVKLRESEGIRRTLARRLKQIEGD